MNLFDFFKNINVNSTVEEQHSVAPEAVIVQTPTNNSFSQQQQTSTVEVQQPITQPIQEQVQTQPIQQQIQTPTTQPESTTAQLLQKIEELQKANLALLNQTTVQKQPSFDECVYNIYIAERGITDGRNN